MRILIDMDGIVVNLLEPWLREYNALWDDKLTVDDITGWDTARFAKPECGSRIFEVFKKPGWFDNLPAYPGAIESVTDLCEAGHEVRFATAAPTADAARGKTEWISREFKHLGFGIRHMVFSHEKEHLKGDVLIDDKPATIRRWRALREEGERWPRVMTIGHPYNRDCRDIADLYAEGYRNTEKAWRQIVRGILTEER